MKPEKHSIPDSPSDDSAGSSADDHVVAGILERYLMDREEGLVPDLSGEIEKHPHLEERIRDGAEGLDAVEHFANRAICPEGNPSVFPRIDDYRIIEEIGRGGMGIVYRAEQISLSRPVALKVLPLAAVFEPKNVARFKNEALATAQLNHPGIVNVFAVGPRNGIHFYAMQLIDGQPLSQVIRELRPVDASRGAGPSGSSSTATEVRIRSRIQLTGSEATRVQSRDQTNPDLFTSGRGRNKSGFFEGVARLALQAATALQHAHENGIIHRDIKPSNLLMDNLGNVLVSDFGLARIHDQTELTATGDLLGTLRYMSPEQTSGRPEMVDHRTDIYSLGATFYELLTCRSAVQGHGRSDILANIRDGRVTPIRYVRPDIPDDLETIILKAMSHDRDQRYLTAGEFAEDLQRFLDHQPILARRPTLRQRTGKWLRRNPGVVTTAAVLFVIMSLSSLAASLLIYRQYEKKMRAEAALQKQNNELEDALNRATSAETRVGQIPLDFERLGIEFFENRSYSEAVKMFDGALVLDPESHRSRLFRARALYSLGRVDEAQVDFDALIENGAELANSFLYRGLLRLDQNEPARALRDLCSAEAAGCEDRLLPYYLLRTNFEVEDFEAVVECSARAAETGFKSADVAVATFVALRELERFEESATVAESFLTATAPDTDGRRLCLSALIAFDRSAPESEELFYRALRWFQYRLSCRDDFYRETVFRLIDHCNEITGAGFDARLPEHWNQLDRKRLESSRLLATCTVSSGLLPRKQSSMNNDWGEHWTPVAHPGDPNNGVQMFWFNGQEQPRSRLTFTFDATSGRSADIVSGENRLTGYLTSSNDYGIVQLWINGKKVGKPVDLFDPAPDPQRSHATQNGELEFGTVHLNEGQNVLEVEVVGKNPRSVGFNVGIDFVEFWPVDFVPGR